jgi:hypothetical protein
MRPNRDFKVDVTRWTAGKTNFTLTGKVEAHSVGNSGGNL